MLRLRRRAILLWAGARKYNKVRVTFKEAAPGGRAVGPTLCFWRRGLACTDLSAYRHCQNDIIKPNSESSLAMFLTGLTCGEAVEAHPAAAAEGGEGGQGAAEEVEDGEGAAEDMEDGEGAAEELEGGAGAAEGMEDVQGVPEGGEGGQGAAEGMERLPRPAAEAALQGDSWVRRFACAGGRAVIMQVAVLARSEVLASYTVTLNPLDD